MTYKIAIDIDGTIADLIPAWLEAYEMLGGERLEPAQITEYEMVGQVADPEKLWRALGNADYVDVMPMPGLIDAINLLRAAGHNLAFVSAVPGCAPKHYAGKLAWCQQHIPGFKSPELCFIPSSQKYRFSADILVEDYPDTIERWQAAGAFRQGVCVTQPYNLSYNADYRVASLLEFAERLVGK